MRGIFYKNQETNGFRGKESQNWIFSEFIDLCINMVIFVIIYIVRVQKMKS